MTSSLKKLETIPFGTPEHTKFMKKVQSGLTYKEYVLCTHGRFSDERVLEADVDLVKDNRLAHIFPDHRTTFENKNFYFVQRNAAEYNAEHRQINVGILVYDQSGNVLIMEKNSNGHYGLVGGHVEYDPTCYKMSVSELCHKHMLKEFNEEVRTDFDPSEIPFFPAFMINEVECFWDLHHSWYVYIKEVDDVKQYGFKSGEPKKIKVHVGNIDDIIGTKRSKLSLRRACILLKEHMENSRYAGNTFVMATKPDI